MQPTNLSQYYQGQNKPLPTTAVDRFADPAFKTAAEKAGYDVNSYHVNINNADANNKILSNLLGGQGPASNLISTSGPSKSAFSNNSNALSLALQNLGGGITPPDNSVEGTNNDPIMQHFATLQSNSDAASKSLIASTQALYQNQMNKVNQQYENYKGGLQQLGIEHNEAQFTPDLLAGHIQQAATEQLDKIHGLQAEESKTLIDAQKAKEEGDFRTLQSKMDYLKQIKADKANAIKTMYDNISAVDKVAGIEAHDIYDTLQGLDKNSQEAFIHAVATKFKIPPASLVAALTDEQTKRKDADLTTKQKEATLAKTNRTGTGTKASKVTVKSASSALDKALKPESQGGVLGDDGYMDPYKWVAQKREWIKDGLTTSTFDNLYKQYLNPDSYELAGFKTGDSGQGA